MRFGLDTGPEEFGPRETAMIVNALNNQRRYSAGLAARNKDPEAAGRNAVNALEISVLIDKIKAIPVAHTK